MQFGAKRIALKLYFWVVETKKITFLQAKVKMEAWCAYQERCQSEVISKLKALGLDYKLIDPLVAELIASDFINEERFAEAYVSGKFNIKRWGREKIRKHLRMKQISAYSVEKALKQISTEDYRKTILKLMAKKSADFKPSDSAYQRRAKLHNYLASKGYEFNEIEICREDFEAEARFNR